MPSAEEARAELARRELVRRKARTSLTEFCQTVDPLYERARHTDYLIEHLEALERRDIDRLIVQMPPRHSKTYHVSERFPAWYLGKRGRCQVILAGNSQELVDGASRKVRGLVSDARYPFKVKLDPASHAVDRWHTTAGGTVIARGVEAAVTGHGADLLCIDDPVKDRKQADSITQSDHQWDWYTDVARLRLMPRAAQLVTSTRWTDHDLIGRLLNSKEANQWTVVTMPAIAVEGDRLGRKPGEALWPEWFPLDALLAIKAIMSPRSWAALYQQSPIPLEGAIFKAEWFSRKYTNPPTRFRDVAIEYGFVEQERRLIIVQAIDAAWKEGIGNSYSVIATWASDDVDYYILDVWRDRVEYPDLVRVCKEQFVKHQPDAIYVEDQASGKAIIQSFTRATALPIIAVMPVGSKEARADSVTPAFEAGKIIVPHEAPWFEEWKNEHLRFPAGTYNDQVDTTSLALSELIKRSYNVLGSEAPDDIVEQLSGWMSR